MKRFFALLLAFTLAFALVACSPKPDTPQNPSGDVGNKDNPFGDSNDPIDTPLVDLDPIS